MNTTIPGPDRAELEKLMATIRHQISAARTRLERLESNRGHLYRRESVLRGLQTRPGREDPENVARQLSETLADLEGYRVKIEAIETEIENLQARALEHIEVLESRRRLPGLVRDLQTLWALRASRGRVAPSLPAFAGDLIREPLQAAGRAFQNGETDMAAITGKLKRSYRI